MFAQVLISKFKEDFKDHQFSNKANLIKCLGDPTCLKILFVMSHEKVLCPSDLESVLELSLPAISHQLQRLKQIGIVTNERMGQSICYSLANSQNAKLIKKITSQVFKDLNH